MLILLSPAKRLNQNEPIFASAAKQPVFLEDAKKVNKSLKKLSAKKLMALQNISKELALENYMRNQTWATQPEEKRYFEAVTMFNGDAYLGLDAATLTNEAQIYAEDHLRILSGLYGLLKPNDIIEPYRLEMGTTLKVGRPNNLYEFWKKKITAHLKSEFNETPILNLASKEYAKAVDFKALKAPVMHVDFKDQNAHGDYKVMSFFAKKARGFMARFVLENKITDFADLTAFNTEGYKFSSADSSTDKLVFLRDH